MFLLQRYIKKVEGVKVEDGRVYGALIILNLF